MVSWCATKQNTVKPSAPTTEIGDTTNYYAISLSHCQPNVAIRFHKSRFLCVGTLQRGVRVKLEVVYASLVGGYGKGAAGHITAMFLPKAFSHWGGGWRCDGNRAGADITSNGRLAMFEQWGGRRRYGSEVVGKEPKARQKTVVPRARTKKKAGSTYGVDPRLREALDFGDLSPNLPAPRGFDWEARSGVWSLAPKGG